MSITALHSPFNISETVRDRGLVSKVSRQQETAYGVSNAHVADDLT